MKPSAIASIRFYTPAGHPVDTFITDSFLHDVLVTAFDPGYGGSLYWGRIKRDPVGTVRPRRPWSVEKIWKLAYEGEPFVIEVIEAHYSHHFGADPEIEVTETHELTRQKLVEGIEKWIAFMVSRRRTQFMMRSVNPSDWDLDSDYADMIVQFAVFGELTFG